MSGKVEICGVNTSKLPRYKDKEMQEMLAAVKAGDSKMRDEIFALFSVSFRSFREEERTPMIFFRWAAWD